MDNYLSLLNTVLTTGSLCPNRTKVNAITVFGCHLNFDLRKGFPLITTKKIFFRGIVHELIWFISGSQNIAYLCKQNVNIWNEWPFKKYQKSESYKGESILDFAAKIRKNSAFAKKWGDLGPVYGKQWRNFNGVDQFKKIIEEIKINPTSRRLLICSWNVSELEEMLLPPCHILFQFHVENNHYLSGHLYQRSADLFLGVPFNIASYALLLSLVAKECGLVPKMLYISFGNVHIYENHINAVKQQLKLVPYKPSKLELNYSVTTKSIFDIKYTDITLVAYKHHPRISAEIAV